MLTLEQLAVAQEKGRLYTHMANVLVNHAPQNAGLSIQLLGQRHDNDHELAEAMYEALERVYKARMATIKAELAEMGVAV